MNFGKLLKGFFALVLICSMSAQVLATEPTTEPTNDQVYLLGNCASSGMDNSMIFGLTGDKVHTVGGATLLTLDKLQAKATSIVGIRVFVADEVLSGKVFLGKDYLKPEVEKEFTYKKGGWQYVMFDEPYQFTADTYIGYLATGSTSFLALEQATKATKTEMIHLDGEWSTVYESLGKYYLWSIQAIVVGGDYSKEVQNNVILDKYSVSESVKVGNIIEASCEVRNAGIIPAENVLVKCTIGEETKTVAIEDVLLNGQTALVNFTDFIAPEIEEAYADLTVNFEVEYELDAYVVDNKAKTTLPVFSNNAVERNAILIEQFTGQGCGYCPNGAKALKAAIDGMVDAEKVIWVAHHAGYTKDDFTLNESLSIANDLRVSGAPSCAVDRMPVEYMPGTAELVWHPAYSTTPLLESLLEVPGLATIDLSYTYDEATRKLTVTVKGNSLMSTAYITVLVKQDGIIAKQANGGNNYEHNNAPRKFLTSSSQGDLLTLGANGEYEVSYEWEIPGKVGKFACAGNMTVVAFVHGKITSAAQRMVYNADHASFNVENIVAVDYTYANDMCIYPNPATDVLFVEGMNAGDVVKVYTIDGILVNEQQIGITEASINVSGLSAGTYFLQVNEKVVKFVKK